MRMVLLLHESPDGTSHYDWMVERPGDRGGGPLITLRVSERIDQPGVDRCAAVRLPDHRRDYLEYEGEVSGGRGRVRRIARGTVVSVREDPRLEVAGGFAGGRAGVWRVEDGEIVWRET